ncbi:hypothetical protein N0V90_004415 [Kalmusia sp. IMI 367209]|nr:hypothetical protein N0V90_004415 [Kalmusia sp. IMI 367209]
MSSEIKSKERASPIRTDISGAKHQPFATRFRQIPSSTFPAEPNRYALYIHIGCPWAHRTYITRALKGLEDIVQLIVLDDAEKKDGKMLWCFSGEKRDPLYGFKYLKELYEKSEPGYDGRYLVPTLWDKKTEKIVNNESSEIIRMFYSEFDALLPENQRESTKGSKGLYPPELRSEIDAMNEWVYDTINNGVYKTGFATNQAAYEGNVYPLFKSLDRIEEHLSQPGHQPYLFGENITEADIRLYTTMIRFDVAYFTIMGCNLKMIRYEYPRIHEWLRRLYWDEGEKTNGGAFKKTTHFSAYKVGYASAKGITILPVGPVPDILPL